MSNGKDVSMWMDEARQIAAQCWCDPETSGTEMDVTLCESVARRIAAWMDTGAQHARNEEYWRNRTADAENRIAALEAKVRGLEAIDAARTNAVQEAIDNAAIYQDQLAASRQQVERLVEALKGARSALGHPDEYPMMPNGEVTGLRRLYGEGPVDREVMPLATTEKDMKKTELKETTYCDHCGKEAYVTACLCCGTEHCWECRKTEGKEYSHGVHFSGSGDGYYCSKCDAELTKSGSDELHAAYRAIASLRAEAEAWGTDFQRRQKAAEARLEDKRHNV